MAARTLAPKHAPGEEMGQVFVDFTVENSAELGVAAASRRAAISLRSVMMDTGATHLCLPADVVATLGLALLREVPVQVAGGIDIRRIFANALVRYEDRSASTDCIELPEGSPPLLGAIPMEALGIEPDLQTRTVRKLPLGPDRSYLMT